MPDYNLSSRLTNSCALLEQSDYEAVVQAAHEYISAQGALSSLTSGLGSYVEGGFEKLPEGFKREVLLKIRDALEYARSISMTGMDNDVGREASNGLYGLTSVASGAVGGFFGLPAIVAELPITTLTIMRSIADIARSKGADLNDIDVQDTCIEVFAYGGPLDEDDDADVAFFTSRLAARGASEAIVTIAMRFAANLGPKFAAQAVPVVGSVLGAGLNWSYMQFYQTMASVLFTLRPIELKYDRDQVRSCFGAIVSELRQKRTDRSRKR